MIKEQAGYLGNPNLRRATNTRGYSQKEFQEILECADNIEYFAETYCKIITLEGEELIKLYEYQKELLLVMHKGKPQEDKYNTIVLSPRQCISNSTILEINKQPMVAIDLFNECSENQRVYANSMYIDSYEAKDQFIETPNGKVEIEFIHRTIAFDAFEITTENGLVLICSGNHSLMKGSKEIQASKSLGHLIDTARGPSKVVSVLDLHRKETMIDLSLKSTDQVYYSNGMASHNSGKCVTGDTVIKILKDGNRLDTTIKEFHDSL